VGDWLNMGQINWKPLVAPYECEQNDVLDYPHAEAMTNRGRVNEL